MARCTKFAGYADGSVWECTRERGHDGPCAAVQVAGGECGHRALGHPLPCPLPAGHGTPHAMSLCGQWWKPAPGISMPCQLHCGHSGQHRAEVTW